MLKYLQFACSGLLLAAAFSSPTAAAERPTLRSTNDPRPDILAYQWYYSHPEYRRTYNRPRYYAGWLAHVVSPTSQEAMVWCENNQAGNYDEKHLPPMCKRYFAPKPWEVLNTDARPDFPKQVQPLAPANADMGEIPAGDKVQESLPIILQ